MKKSENKNLERKRTLGRSNFDPEGAVLSTVSLHLQQVLILVFDLMSTDILWACCEKRNTSNQISLEHYFKISIKRTFCDKTRKGRLIIITGVLRGVPSYHHFSIAEESLMSLYLYPASEMQVKKKKNQTSTWCFDSDVTYDSRTLHLVIPTAALLEFHSIYRIGGLPSKMALIYLLGNWSKWINYEAEVQ